VTIIDNGDFFRALFEFFSSPLGLGLLALVAARIAIDRAFPRRRRRASAGAWPKRARSMNWNSPMPARPKFARPPKRYDEEALGDIRDFSADEFEDFVADLFVKRGYGATIVGGDGDHGVDIVVTNPQGERELVQCKRWDRRWIGEPIVRDFYGAFVHDGDAVRGYVVTTSCFSEAAREWAEGKPIHLIDGKQLAEAVEVIGR
jgi:restriction system protein